MAEYRVSIVRGGETQKLLDRLIFKTRCLEPVYKIFTNVRRKALTGVGALLKRHDDQTNDVWGPAKFSYETFATKKAYQPRARIEFANPETERRVLQELTPLHEVMALSVEVEYMAARLTKLATWRSHNSGSGHEFPSAGRTDKKRGNIRTL